MSGVTSIVDTMLPSKLAQRIDLVPLKPEIEIAGTEAVATTEKVSNDVRLPSRAAILRQLGPGLIDLHDAQDVQNAHDGADTPRTASASAHTTLSVAARAINAILGPTPGLASAVRGSAPVWSQPGAPVPQQLAAALARTVASSGLFYESHLSQFASGARTLAELAQEPQARLGPQAGSLAALRDGIADPATPPAPTASSVSPHPVNPAAAAGPVAAAVASAIADAVHAALPPAAADIADQAGSDAGSDATPQLPNTGASHRPTSASIAAAYNASGTAGLPQFDVQPLHAAEPDVDVDAVKSAQPIASDVTRGSSQVVVGMHQDAVALVRQQLDLLAVPVFRWSGEVWPGTQMDWELSEERKNQQQDAGTPAAPRTWQTRLTMTLPTLGAIEVRLSMVDAQLQAHLAAGEETSIALLRNDGDELRQRFAAAGLQLTGLQIAPLEQKT